MRIVGDMKAVPMVLLDSVYRNNESRTVKISRSKSVSKKTDRLMMLKLKLESTKNKKKRELMQIEINEILMALKLENENRKKRFSNLNSDGFIILECSTLLTKTLKIEEQSSPVIEVHNPYGTRFISKYAKKTQDLKNGIANESSRSDILVTTNVRVKIINSIYESAKNVEREYLSEHISSGRPSPHDHMQTPKWFNDINCSTEGSIFNDDILTSARLDPGALHSISYVESSRVLSDIELLYSAGAMADFTKEREQREVDVERPGTMTQLTSVCECF